MAKSKMVRCQNSNKTCPSGCRHKYNHPKIRDNNGFECDGFLCMKVDVNLDDEIMHCIPVKEKK